MLRKRAFTLVEMLVVISLIVLLIGLLLPSLASSRETARDVKCRTQLRSVMQAFQSFSDFNHGRMPGIWTQGPEYWQKAWLGTEAGTGGAGGAFKGTIASYLGSEGAALETYRCPSLNVAPWGSGQGSNGKFDYSAFVVFSGAKFQSIPSAAEYRDPGSNVVTRTTTPVIIEENPAHHINGCCIEGGFGSIDQQSTTHRGGSNYAAIDTSAHRLIFTKLGPTTYDWTIRAPSGTIISMSDSVWGGWGLR
ncbi:MAG: prepilin-type N-terminal cleavage/methylation domain-containing protein [Phycisphaeraceae bacterium]